MCFLKVGSKINQEKSNKSEVDYVNSKFKETRALKTVKHLNTYLHWIKERLHTILSQRIA